MEALCHVRIDLKKLEPCQLFVFWRRLVRQQHSAHMIKDCFYAKLSDEALLQKKIEKIIFKEACRTTWHIALRAELVQNFDIYCSL